MFVQRLPGSASGDALTPEQDAEWQDNWRRAKILMDSATENELVDISLGAHDLIWRLFHDEEPRVFEQNQLQFKCRCSRQKIEGALAAYPLDELLAMREAHTGEVGVTCQFCNTHYGFNEADLRFLKAGDATADDAATDGA